MEIIVVNSKKHKMKLSDVKKRLNTIESVVFQLPNGTFVPNYFHVTEVGLITKNFIDCGGIVRNDTVINFQLWDANDFEHRLKPKKLLDIIALSESVFKFEDLEIEVEYQEKTISKFDLDFNGKNFVLVNKKTACLALDQCSIPLEKKLVRLSDLKNESNCTPENGCC